MPAEDQYPDLSIAERAEMVQNAIKHLQGQRFEHELNRTINRGLPNYQAEHWDAQLMLCDQGIAALRTEYAGYLAAAEKPVDVPVPLRRAEGGG